MSQTDSVEDKKEDVDIYMEDEKVSDEHLKVMEALDIPHGKNISIHRVHLNHLDLTWYWRLADTIEMCMDTICWHVEMLEKHPDARYSHTQVFIIKVVEKLDPYLFERFRKLVSEGRIEIDSGQVVEPDHNMPSGESIVRQFLFGQRYIMDKFGIKAVTLINSDSFGHCRSLPQIIKKSGLKYMLFKRPTQEDEVLPETPFVWIGIDGTELPAMRFVNKGNGLPRLSWGPGGKPAFPEGANEIQEKVDRNIAIGNHHLFASHCNSDAGGVTPYLSPLTGERYKLFYSRPADFFKTMLACNPNLPVLDRLLNYQFTGCYTTHIEEKEHCRRAEKELRQTELLWSIAALNGHGYPFKELSDCWWRFCYLQFHDILPGTGSHEAHADSSSHYHELFLRLNLLRRRAQILLDRCFDTRDSWKSLVVCNSRADVCDEIVKADIDLRKPSDNGMGEYIPDKGVLEDEQGRRIPYQVIDQRERQRYVHGNVLFRAQELSPLGLSRYRFLEEEPVPAGISINGNTIENDRLKVEVGGPGIILSMITKKDGREWLKKKEAPVAIELWPETLPGTMKAWRLGNTDHREDAACISPPEAIENGPVRATIRIMHQWGDSIFKTDVSLYAGQEWVEIRTDIDWHEKDTLARLRIEPDLAGKHQFHYGIPFGYEKATGEENEVPAVGWSNIRGENGGIALLNMDRPGNTFTGDRLRISLVRCSTGPFDPCSDSGMINTVLRILPHEGNVKATDIQRHSDVLCHPSAAWQCNAFRGVRQKFKTPLSIEGEGLQLSCFKAAEDQSGYVFRIYESMGKESKAVIRLGKELSGLKVYEGNLLEEVEKELYLNDDKLFVDFMPFEIKTFLFKTPNAIPESFSGNRCDIFSV